MSRPKIVWYQTVQLNSRHFKISYCLCYDTKISIFYFSNWQEIESQLDEFVDILTQEFLQPDIHGLRKGPSAWQSIWQRKLIETRNQYIFIWDEMPICAYFTVILKYKYSNSLINTNALNMFILCYTFLFFINLGNLIKRKNMQSHVFERLVFVSTYSFSDGNRVIWIINYEINALF